MLIGWGGDYANQKPAFFVQYVGAIYSMYISLITVRDTFSLLWCTACATCLELAAYSYIWNSKDGGILQTFSGFWGNWIARLIAHRIVLSIVRRPGERISVKKGRRPRKQQTSFFRTKEKKRERQMRRLKLEKLSSSFFPLPNQKKFQVCLEMLEPQDFTWRRWVWANVLRGGCWFYYQRVSLFFSGRASEFPSPFANPWGWKLPSAILGCHSLSSINEVLIGVRFLKLQWIAYVVSVIGIFLRSLRFLMKSLRLFFRCFRFFSFSEFVFAAAVLP